MDKYFSIGEVSKITGLSIDRLRNYDKIGLLKPSYIDPKSGYRYYSENKFRKLRIIKYLRKIGTPLKEIDLILNKNNMIVQSNSINRKNESYTKIDIYSLSQIKNQKKNRLKIKRRCLRRYWNRS